MRTQDRYKRNFVKKAIIEIRFPILMELGEHNPPASFVKGIRQLFPYHISANSLQIGGDTDGSKVHVFRSANSRFQVSLSTSNVSIETEGLYGGFDKMMSALVVVVKALKPVIETDFFTRIGLRYINVIPCKSDPWDGWIRHELVAPIATGGFQGVFEYSGRLCFSNDDVGCSFNHGIKLKDQESDEDTKPNYALDIDAYQDVVEFANWEVSLEKLHATANEVFEWAIGSKTRAELTAD